MIWERRHQCHTSCKLTVGLQGVVGKESNCTQYQLLHSTVTLSSHAHWLSLHMLRHKPCSGVCIAWDQASHTQRMSKDTKDERQCLCFTPFLSGVHNSASQRLQLSCCGCCAVISAMSGIQIPQPDLSNGEHLH